MAGPWGIEICGQTGKRLLGELMERQRHTLESFPYHFPVSQPLPHVHSQKIAFL